MYYDDINVVSFVIESGKTLSIGVRFEANVKKWGRWSCFCCLFLSPVLWDYINGIQVSKFWLIIDRTSLIHLKALPTVCFVGLSYIFFIRCCIELKENIDKERGTVGSHEALMTFWQKCPQNSNTLWWLCFLCITFFLLFRVWHNRLIRD